MICNRSWFVAAFLCLACSACGDPSDAPSDGGAPSDSALPDDGEVDGGELDSGAPDAAYSCTPTPTECPAIDIGDDADASLPKPCCAPTYACGYELPELDEENMMLFPDVEGFVAQLASGDPNGRCVPESFFFGPRPGLWKHRVEVEDGEDILIAPECDSYTLLAYILPGCCMPNNKCGLSTDESRTTLEFLLMGSAPFTQPECVSAAELNQQFRDSVKLETFARIADTTGTCDYAAINAELSDAGLPDSE